MKEELRELMREALALETEPLRDWMLEQNARLSAQQLLLETLFANAFLEDPDGLRGLIDGLIEKTRTAATKAEPVEAEEAAELQARIATRLQRFGQSVLLRLRQDGT